jgi:hypothetical protein
MRMGAGVLAGLGGRGTRWLAVAMLATLVMVVLPPVVGAGSSAGPGTGWLR